MLIKTIKNMFKSVWICWKMAKNDLAYIKNRQNRSIFLITFIRFHIPGLFLIFFIEIKLILSFFDVFWWIWVCFNQFHNNCFDFDDKFGLKMSIENLCDTSINWHFSPSGCYCLRLLTIFFSYKLVIWCKIISSNLTNKRCCDKK